MNPSSPLLARAAALAPLVLSGLAATPAAAQGGGPAPTPVRVDPARQEEVQAKRRVTGEIRPQQRSLVAVREPGLVAELLVREGQRIEAGQVLARLDDARLRDELAVVEAELAQARAAIAQQEAVLARTERDVTVLEDLAGRDAVNPKELADARSEVAVESARLTGSERAVGVLESRRAWLEQRVGDLEPKAPFAGAVVAEHTEAGQWLAAGGAVVELVSDRALEARIDVPQTYYAPLRGFQASIVLEAAGGGTVHSSEWRVVPQVTSTGRTFPLIVDLDDAAGLAPGMSVTAEVPTGERTALLTISRDAILRSPTGYYAYVARPGQGEGAPHTAQMAPLEVLFHVGDRAVVRTGALAPGDLVVVEGNERLYPTAAVKPMQGGPTEAGSAGDAESKRSSGGGREVAGGEDGAAAGTSGRGGEGR